MIKDLIINKIEAYYKQYMERRSGLMFNESTDFFFDSLMQIPYCKTILDDLEKICDITIPQSGYIELDKIIMAFIGKGQAYYAAFCLHFYRVLRKRREHTIELRKELKPGEYAILKPYCKYAIWTNESVNEAGDTQQLFKTDFVRPIVDYIINLTTNENAIRYFIERYKERAELFRTVKIDDNTKEYDLQEDLALYLYDNGLTFYQEVKRGNGRLDFMVDIIGGEHYGCAIECNDKPYIIEVKHFRDHQQIEDGICQLKRYMNRTNAYGCLLVYVDKDNFLFDINNPYEDITILYIDLIINSPSKKTLNDSGTGESQAAKRQVINQDIKTLKYMRTTDEQHKLLK